MTSGAVEQALKGDGGLVFTPWRLVDLGYVGEAVILAMTYSGFSTD